MINKIENLIPAGAHTYSRADDQFPSNAPKILSKGKGAYVWDNNGNKFIDYGMGLRTVTLGYANKRVNDAVIKAINKGVNLTRSTNYEYEAARLLIKNIKSVEMVKFAKNGSNVTTAAIKLARSYNQKKYICVPREHPFFSFDDWFIGSTPMNRGVPKNISKYTLTFNYGDINSLINLFNKYKDDIAAVILEPSTTLTPCNNICGHELTFKKSCRGCKNNNNNFLKDVQKICNKNKSIFILDEIVTGFRWHNKGAQHYFDVNPDLSTFGKAMANGFSISALGGKKSIMNKASINKKGMERTFLLSSTYGGEMTGLAAFLETQKIYKEEQVCEKLWNIQKKLRKIFEKNISKYNLDDNFKLSGPDICLSYSLFDKDNKISLPLKTLFMQEMVKNKILMPWISASIAHNDQILKRTDLAIDKSFKIIKKAIDSEISKYLIGNSVKPVFRKYN